MWFRQRAHEFIAVPEERRVGGGWHQAGTGQLELREVLTATTNNSGWMDSALTAMITNSGIYKYRCMVCGSGTVVTSDVYFDEVKIWKQGREWEVLRR